MPSYPDVLVVVLSRNYSTGLSIVRSLGLAGFTVDVVSSVHEKGYSDIIASSKYVRNSTEIRVKKISRDDDEKQDGEELLVERLLQYADAPEKTIVLFPVDDYSVSFMDLNRGLLSSIFVMPEMESGTQGQMVASMDKDAQSKAAVLAGIQVPQEWIITLNDDELTIPEDIPYPCFCKPAESFMGYKSEMAKCRDRESLRKHLRRARRRNPNRSMLVQEFLEIQREIDIQGVCFDQEVIIPAIINKTRIAQYERGVTLTGQVAPPEELGETILQIANMMKSFHYKGMFDMEINIVDGKPYFNEINFRCGGPNYAYLKSGVNLPELFIKQTIGQSISEEERTVSEFGKSFVYEKVAWDDYGFRYMTKKELNEVISKADIRLFGDEEDPEPGIIFQQRASATADKRRGKTATSAPTADQRPLIRRVASSAKQSVHHALWKIKRGLLPYPQSFAANKRNASSKTPRAMVVGRDYCANLNLARSLGKAGYEVEIMRLLRSEPKKTALHKRLKPELGSKYAKAFRVCVSKRKGLNLFHRLMKAANPRQKMLLFTSDDLVLSVLDRYYDRLSMFYIMPNVNHEQGQMNYLLRRDVQTRLMSQAGLPTLSSHLVAADKGKLILPEGISYPCFVKPNVSRINPAFTLRKYTTEDGLRAALEKQVVTRDINVLVQDYISIEKRFSLAAICTDEKVLFPALIETVDAKGSKTRGITRVGSIQDPSKLDSLLEKLADFLLGLKYSGPCNIDVAETSDGELFIIELNLRFATSDYAFTQCGVNIPGIYADYVTKGILPESCEIQQAGRTFINEKILLEDYIAKKITLRELKEFHRDADMFLLKDREDIRPYQIFKLFYPFAMVKRRMGK